ncbi:MAG: tyrosine-type recombinase/integrase [Pseudomonadota bacterium]
MAILAECPICHKKQTTRNKVCTCGADLDKAKRSQRVRFWIQYRLPGGKQKKEYVGLSIEEARDADGKRRVQKRENRIFDIKPETKMTFNQLTEWYLKLEKVKALASYDIIKISLDKFNKEFGNIIVSRIKPVDLENYQARRLKEGKAPGTVDHEIGKAKSMIYKAFDNDFVGGDTLKTFKRVKKTLKPGSDVRDRLITADEFESLMKHSEGHTKAIISMGYYTGMRKGEILNLTWDKIDLAARLIRLEAGDTKDKEARNIPICKELFKVLMVLPNRIHGSNADNHVFQFRGKPITDIRTALRQACKDAGIEYGRFVKGGFIFHDLRHTFNTNMRKAGGAESVIMAITGHSTRAMFDRYNRIDDDDTRKAIEQLEGYFASVTQNVTQEGAQEEKIN